MLVQTLQLQPPAEVSCGLHLRPHLSQPGLQLQGQGHWVEELRPEEPQPQGAWLRVVAPAAPRVGSLRGVAAAAARWRT